MFSILNCVLLLKAIAFVACLPTDNSFEPNNKLILILADGVRYDYVNDPNLHGFHQWSKSGVKAEYVQPIFPANSYPNWYTIVTGLYAESHGMVQNFMFDPKYNETFLMYPHPNASHLHWWNEAVPLWVSAEEQGVRTAVFWWDGCQVAIRNMTPTHCEEYQPYWTWPKPKEDTIDALHQILENFQTNEWQLGLVYYEAVDAIGHAWGPETSEREDAVRDLDEILMNLYKEIHKRKLENEVNVVLVSDHGMTAVHVRPPQSHPKHSANLTKLIDIEKIVDENDVQVMLDRGSTSFLIPKPGKESKVYDTLKNADVKGLHVYKKSEIPYHYHIKEHRRVPPIVLVADKGYFVRGFSQHRKTKPVWDVLYTGHHGYDPYEVEEMRTIMYGFGPGLKRNYVNDPLMMTDHYNLLCHLLGIEAQPNNGSWIRVQNMLAKSAKTVKRSPVVLVSQARSVTSDVPSALYIALPLIYTLLILK